MPPVKSFNEFSPWADSPETISQLDRITCLFDVILHRKYSQGYNKPIYPPVFQEMYKKVMLMSLSDNNLKSRIIQH